ncbi:MAG: hypothetical protein MUE81_06210 [Thermoflexibacter sp.]|jgi:hypothetical protein|nr:hypothetical protein [Thermoflexibacter sp.]
MKYLFPLFLLIVLLTTCKQAQQSFLVKKGFYHWKTNFNSYEAAKMLDSMEVKKFYVKFFDVSYNELQGAIPLAELQGSMDYFPDYDDFKSKERAKIIANRSKEDSIKYTENPYFYNFPEVIIPDSVKLEIIPTVFITNFTFEKLNKEQVSDLVKKVSAKLNNMIKKENSNEHYPKIFQEIQFDCDWSEKTKDKFFAFLAEFKKLNPNFKLSATIRLYQYKYYQKAGVPPVEKGMLMFYNLTSLQNPNVTNSILDISEAKKYLTPQKYPLKLDFALPIFSWGLIFRGGQYVDIYRTLDSKQASKLKFLKKTGENQFVSLADTVHEKFYLREGDNIRIEEVSENQLVESVKLLRNIANQNSITVTFFHLDRPLINKYGYETFEKIYKSF